jgi:cytochrome c553
MYRRFAARALQAFILLTCAPAAFAQSALFEERKPACLQCHGENGLSNMPDVPSLGGLPEFYALLQLVAFREGNREVEIMNDMTKGMTDDDLRAAAAFVARQPRPPAPNETGDPARMARGRDLAKKHRCGFCHGAAFLGGEQMPPLRHQREDYLLKSLRDYKADKRIGDRAAMAEVLYPLKDNDLADLAHFLAHVKDR